MRRTIFPILGLGEFFLAGVLIYAALLLPDAAEIDQHFTRTEAVTRKTAVQVERFRDQVHRLRRPEVQLLAERLRAQTRIVTATLRNQPVDYDTMETMRDALGDVAAGLEGLSRTLDPERVGKLGDGLGLTASFLDEKLLTTTAKVADRIDEATALLQKDATRLSGLLRDAPPDLKAARDVRDSLGRFGEGLDALKKILDEERLKKMREGFDGLEDALATAADQIEGVAKLTYPVMKFRGLTPEITQRAFWPEGDKIARGLRKAASGVTAAGTEMDGLIEALPKVQTALDESRSIIEKTRQALATALKHQEKVEPLLRDAPAHAARLAEQLPRLGADLSRLLRDTSKLKEVADALRQAQKGIDSAVAQWPQLQRTLARSAKFLGATRDQLDHVLQHRQEYETARKQMVLLGEGLATMLPLFTEQMDAQLEDQERTLEDLSTSIHEVGDTIPAFAETTTRFVQLGRMLLGVLAFMAGLHGTYLAAGGFAPHLASVASCNPSVKPT